jgi:hypothetical protein
MVENNRPNTDADCVIFSGANTMTNSRDMQNWIKENGLARN